MQETKTESEFTETGKTAYEIPTVTFSKMIGRTSYDVVVYYGNGNNETLKNKLLRLMKNEIEKGEFYHGKSNKP